ncbi:MAG: hypothetical protein HY320_07125 [Armatimonadetes bacterium]|nr:hypothetical protein [Armatimonadota bacterium]
MSQHGYTTEEIGHRGQELYDRVIRPQVEAGNKGKFLVLDIETGDYEIDEDDLAASERLLARRPGGKLYGVRIGYPVAYRIGARFTVGRP